MEVNSIQSVDHNQFLDQYNLGFNLGTVQEYETLWGKPVGGSKEWIAYLNGKTAKDKIIYDKKFEELKLQDFLDKLKTLCGEYKVGMNFGCGCCGAGAYCGDLDFSFEIK